MSNLMHQEEDLLESLIPAIAEVKSDAMEWSLNNLRRYDPAFKVPYSIFEVLADEARDLGNRHGFERIPINADDLVLLEQLEAIDDYGFMAPLPRMIVGDIVRHDWSRTGNDVYTVSIGGFTIIRCSNLTVGVLGESSQSKNYVNNHGNNGFYQAIMLHLLPDNMWLDL
ncbi:hypothetical protein QFC21_006629 [Naganishia friedmannii]|uniref:Uncharacterized protein n=1 Tax=Naganishia friedmannii TaxID=89922 RepID=A0ACC2V106_9TREE|nr:hypothetical protein QFC21_006629 [Naganishia friedmannii]